MLAQGAEISKGTLEVDITTTCSLDSISLGQLNVVFPVKFQQLILKKKG